jgi:hypothetical protein
LPRRPSRPRARVGAGGCCGNCGGEQRVNPTRRTKRIARNVAHRENPPLSAAYHGCPLTDTDGYGTWCLESCDETTCTLWLCEPTTEPAFSYLVAAIGDFMEPLTFREGPAGSWHPRLARQDYCPR